MLMLRQDAPPYIQVRELAAGCKRCNVCLCGLGLKDLQRHKQLQVLQLGKGTEC
jgi:hypothetical protein